MRYLTKFSAIIILLISFLLTDTYAQNNDTKIKIDSIQKLKDDTNKVIAYNDLIWEIKFDTINALQVGETSIILGEKLKYNKGLGFATKNIAAVYYYQGNYDKALEYYIKSLEYFEKSGFKIGIGKGNHNLGNIYYQKGNWKQALEFYLTTLSIYEEIDNQHGKALIYNSIGLIYANNDQLADSSIAYYQKALDIFLTLDNQYDIATSYLYMGDYYYRNSFKEDSTNVDIAIDYLEKCRGISIDNEFPRFEATTDELLGKIYLQKGKTEKAYEYFSKSLEINEELGYQFGIANTLVYLSDYHIKMGDYDEAETNLTRAIEIAVNIGAKTSQRDIYEMFSNLYYVQENYEKAMDYYVNYIELKDSLFNKEIDEKITRLNIQYEFEQKQKEQEIINQAKIQRQKTISYFFIVAFILMIILAIVIFKSYKNKQKANKLLADKNSEIIRKNAMLNQQKEEIETQRDEIEQQRDHVILQRDKISTQNNQITQSIRYARRIQKAVLPPQEFINKLFTDSFIFFEPRDIVSGDFYWAAKKDDLRLITAADCTGHGVPGAFMSMLGVSFLNEIINLSSIAGNEIHANDILNKLRDLIISSLRQTGGDDETKDGMDMSLCIVDYKKMEMQFAGAYNSLYQVKNNELNKIKADRMPVGIHLFRGKDNSFTNKIIEINKNDKYYMASDGFVDQFGGENNRKLSTKVYKEMIIENHKKPMNEQKDIFKKAFEDWKNHIDKDGKPYKQVDDVLIIGFEI